MNPSTPAWKALADHFAAIADTTIADYFAQDAERVENFSAEFEDVLLDYSKNRIDGKDK